MKVVVTYRQMHGSAPARRMYHRPECSRLKNRTEEARAKDYEMEKEEALAAGYQRCERCKP